MTVQPKVRGETAVTPMESGRELPVAMPHLIALTRDPALLRALQELATGAVAVIVVADLRSLTDELVQHASAVALLDAASLDAPIEGAVDAVGTQFPDVKLLVAGQTTEQNLLATRISDQRVFRFVHKPASPARLKLFLDAAARPSERAPVRTPITPAAPSTAAPAAGAGARQPGKGGGKRLLPLIAGGALLAIAAAAWLLWPSGDAGQSAAGREGADGAAAAATASAAQPILQRAAAALAANRFVASDGSSAAELYREALRVDARNAKATEGFRRAIEGGLGAAEAQLLAGELDAAATTAETIRLIAPDNARLAFLLTQIEREQARLASDVSQRQALEARAQKIQAALATMQNRLRAGALLEPQAGSALAAFREAEAVSAADPAVRSARETLVAALLTAADEQLEARRLAPARRLLDAAATVNSSAPGLDVMRRRIEDTSLQMAAESLGPASAPPEQALPQPREPAPRPVSATPPVPAASTAPAAPAADPADTVVSANTLRVVRTQAVVYPQSALDRGVSGWVDLEFTVKPDGSVDDVEVTAADPRRVFDSAAIRAVSGYRYEPVLRNGAVVSQRARLRVRFTAVDSR